MFRYSVDMNLLLNMIDTCVAHCEHVGSLGAASNSTDLLPIPYISIMGHCLHYTDTHPFFSIAAR